MAKQFTHVDDNLAYVPTSETIEKYEKAILSDDVQNLGKNLINLADCYAYKCESLLVEKKGNISTSELLNVCKLIFNEKCKPAFKTDLARQLRKAGLNISTHEPFQAISESFDYEKLRSNIKAYHRAHDKGELTIERFEEIKPPKKSPKLTPYGRAMKIPAMCDSVRRMKDCPVELIEFIDDIKAKFNWIEEKKKPLEYVVIKGAKAQEIELTPPKETTPTSFTSEQMEKMKSEFTTSE